RFTRPLRGHHRILWGACDDLFPPRPLGPLHDIAHQTGGPLHNPPDGEERVRLQALLDRLADARPADLDAGRATVLLDGGPDPHARWNLAPLAPLYRRWL
ncbi:MAG: hypothetical protein R3181_13255, partial [Rubricoccaceae bacterium]|nr:hypothetical protein [Rubricoccaceae bacterium]